MTKRMLIDATHAEETRVVVLDGNRLEDFDVETAAKKQLKGNIYLAKVVRVEPSLQAAFVEYGGGRHGFLAFSEIHPDYYQIPVADRQRLLAMQEAEARAEEEADDAAAAAAEAPGRRHVEAAEPEEGRIEASGADHVEVVSATDDFVSGVESPTGSDDAEPAPSGAEAIEAAYEHPDAAEAAQDAVTTAVTAEPAEAVSEAAAATPEAVEPPAQEDAPARTETSTQAAAIAQDVLVAREHIPEDALTDDDFGADTALEAMEPATSDEVRDHGAANATSHHQADDENDRGQTDEDNDRGRADEFASDDAQHDSAGSREDAPDDEQRESRPPARFMRSYKIQEVIRRRQILLVQVVKEERGSKGAALTTYISLAGRFSVLMPNSPRGGGISRKITSTADRRRLKEVTNELQIPRGMGLIVRTAGANRPKAEIKRDCEYLLELWDSIRETTMASMAPALIHEEANLIKRAIRDNYSRDVDEVLVDGEAGWRAARDFMRMLMPAHARKVQLWNQPQPLFAAQAVEAQLDAMLVPTVQLRSGGYLVINQTEALVAIDVNSGRSTRERGIEETALKTNLEAADEVARQLRLRDLAGLIVIDFIDMESRRNNAAVEKRMKDALKDDRARIQLGPISHFGLMEMSRQRLRPSLTETSFTPCPHCGGTGYVRSTETSALAVLRAIEEEGAKRRAAEIIVHVAGAIALYVLNHKRARIAEIEARYGMTVAFAADETLLAPQTRIERVRAQVPGSAPLPVAMPIPISTMPADAEDDLVEEEDEEETEEEAREAAAEAPPGETAEEQEQRSRKRRRRRRGSRREEAGADAPAQFQAQDPAVAEQPEIPALEGSEIEAVAEEEAPKLDAAGEEEARGRRRGRRGGRRRRRDTPEGEGTVETQAGEASDTTEEPASFDAPQSPAPVRPVYAGPTPADPFGGGDMFDIFDVLEQAAERATVSAAATLIPVSPEPPPIVVPDRPAVEAEAAEATVPAEVAPEQAAPVEPEPVAEAPSPAVPEPAVVAEPAEAEPAAEAPPLVAAQPAAAEPVAEAVPEEAAPVVAAAEAAPEPAPLVHATPEVPEPVAEAPLVNGHATPEPTAAPGPVPVLIGEGEAVTEKKRGWWRR